MSATVPALISEPELSQIAWSFEALPFHVGPVTSPDNPISLPNTAPFTLQWDPTLQRLWHAPSSEVSQWLTKAYKQGLQIGTPLNDSGLGLAYTEDFLGFIKSSINTADLTGLRILEVGCGTGYLCKRLKELGANVIGLEPGTQPTYTQEMGIPVIQDFFKAELFDEPFDIILHYMVMEHVDNPLEFIASQMELLKPGGMILSAVPDDAVYFQMADLSTIIHEHYSYFGHQSLTCIASLLNLEAVTRISDIGGALYTQWKPKTTQELSPLLEPWFDVKTFQQSINNTLQQMQTFFDKHADHRIGIYCPSRFLNYVPFFDLPNVSFYDDDPYLHGRFYPPHPAAVQSREDLLNNPVDALLIMSRTFGPRLANTLREQPELQRTEIVTIADLTDA